MKIPAFAFCFHVFSSFHVHKTKLPDLHLTRALNVMLATNDSNVMTFYAFDGSISHQAPPQRQVSLIIDPKMRHDIAHTRLEQPFVPCLRQLPQHLWR